MSFDSPSRRAKPDAPATFRYLQLSSPTSPPAEPGIIDVEHLEPSGDADLQKLRRQFRHWLPDLGISCIGGYMDPTLLAASPWTIRCDEPVPNKDTDSLEHQFHESESVVDMPVLVRPWPPGVGLPVGAPESARYEVLVGTRRIKLQQSQGQKVLVVIMALTNEQAARLVVRSNRSHKKLRPYEEGLTYERLLSDEVYPDQKTMAAALTVQESEVSTALKLARLDPVLIGAFASPLDLQHADGALIERAWKQDADSLRKRALEAATYRGQWKRQKVLRFLLAEDSRTCAQGAATPSERIVDWDDQRIFTLKTTPKGISIVDIAATNLPGGSLDALRKHLEDFMQGPEGFTFIPPKK